jgi:hypothetical protein
MHSNQVKTNIEYPFKALEDTHNLRTIKNIPLKYLFPEKYPLKTIYFKNSLLKKAIDILGKNKIVKLLKMYIAFTSLFCRCNNICYIQNSKVMLISCNF